MPMANFEEIDAARRLLGLGERASLAQIKEAYRRLAWKYHPDRCPEGQGGGEAMRQLNQAYRLLLAYCEEFPISFRREEVERLAPELDYLDRFYSEWFGKGRRKPPSERG